MNVQHLLELQGQEHLHALLAQAEHERCLALAGKTNTTHWVSSLLERWRAVRSRKAKIKPFSH